MRAARIRTVISLLLYLCVLPAAIAADAPDWLHSLAREPLGTYPKETDAVMLLDEGRTSVKENGEIVTLYRAAYKVLRPQGTDVSELSVPFTEDTRLTSLKGWSITARGDEYEVKEKDAIEIGSLGDELYSDRKFKRLKVPGAEVGTVLGFEYEQKRRPYTFEDSWYWHTSNPVKHSRFTLRTPPGWEHKASWINMPPLEPKVSSGGEYVWEMHDLPAIEREPGMPHLRAVAGRLVITFFSAKAQGRSYTSWAELGTWYTQLAASRRELTPAIQEQANKLTAGLPSDLAKIRALATYVQSRIRYVAVEIGIGGYQPHAAGDVLRKSYGDCKDKATALASLLSAVKINSYYVLVHTSRGIFTENTPPTMGFNHVILAIQLPSRTATEMSSVLNHPKLGKLLVFDPTSELVPLGSLPASEQYNYGLLVTPNGGELVKLPSFGPESNRLHRTAKLTLLPDGTLKGSVEEVRSGDAAVTGRHRLLHQTTSDRRKMLEHFLAQLVGNFQLDDVTAENLESSDRDLVLRYSFTASKYAKSMGPLLLVRPRVLGENAGNLEKKERKYAYEFDTPSLQSDEFEITLPSGYQIDELPDAADVKFPFAEYNSKIEAASNVLKYRREYKVKETLVPADKISDLQRLFSEINNDERNVAVLKKVN